MNSLNKFDQWFRKLTRRSGNDPSRLEWLVKNSPEVRRLVGYLYYWRRDFESRLSNHRFFQSVPAWFIARYKLYKEHFGPEVDRVYGELLFRATFAEDRLDGIPREEILHPEGRPPPNEDDAEWFHPGEAVEAVDFMINWLWNMHDGSDHAEYLRTGINAWEWFMGTVGINLAKIEQRWSSLPRAMIPLHADGLTNVDAFDGLVGLLSDATKAYIFGLPAAAIAMCRAVCERVLKDFYVSEDRREETLSNLVCLAEQENPQIKQLKLRRHINLANRAMHNYQGTKQSDKELDVVRQFLETVKVLIEQAPPTPIGRL